MPDIRQLESDVRRELERVTRGNQRIVSLAMAAFHPTLVRLADRGEFGPSGEVELGYFVHSNGQHGMIRVGTRITTAGGESAQCFFVNLTPHREDRSRVVADGSAMAVAPESLFVYYGQRSPRRPSAAAHLTTGNLRGRLDELAGSPASIGAGSNTSTTPRR